MFLSVTHAGSRGATRAVMLLLLFVDIFLEPLRDPRSHRRRHVKQSLLGFDFLLQFLFDNGLFDL